MDETWIRDQLVEHGKKLFNAPKEPIPFTKDDRANVWLNDLEHHPQAFVLGCVMDRQIKAEKAWLIPYRFQEKLEGDFSIGRLASLSPDDVKPMMARPEPLHRFVDAMSGYFYAAVRRIVDQYKGDASRIWQGKPSSADVVYRFLEFDGIGPKIASMAANCLAREFKVPFGDYYSIDISADVHVRRVFGRLGLASPKASVEQIIYRARALHPEFPGLIDFPSWQIGHNWCKPRNRQCHSCYMREGCATAKEQR
ncbi:MAG: iron-sulfur cluster loop [Candidatus Hodarchaeota archaeon]